MTNQKIIERLIEKIIIGLIMIDQILSCILNLNLNLKLNYICTCKIASETQVCLSSFLSSPSHCFAW